MSDSTLLGPPRIQRKLYELADRPLNFDLRALADASPANGWTITDVCQPLVPEEPGMPDDEGSWQIARRLMSGYEFADPSIVRAYYDPEVPLAGRNMLLKLQALRVAHLFVGVRVGDVYEEIREADTGPACVWGWNYRTLEGHLEMGQMDWQVWKWLHDGRVEFRVHSVSRFATIANPAVWLGFRLLRGRERSAFLESTKRRMQSFTELALRHEDPEQPIRGAAETLTARRGQDDPAHDAVAERARRR